VLDVASQRTLDRVIATGRITGR